MTLRRTPLFEEHQALQARLVDFGGWEMPVQYTSILKEHEAVRTAVGLFDVSHMGVFEITGAEAESAVQWLIPNNVKRLQDGGGLYTQLCQENGGVIDDLLVFRWSTERYWLVVNAGNRQVDFDWIDQHLKGFSATLTSLADHTGILALQGPLARQVMVQVMEEASAEVAAEIEALKPFQLKAVTLKHDNHAVELVVSCSGYTGEDGFELYVPHQDLVWFWRHLLSAGEPHGIQPVGLGARDTLRLEAAMPLYGHELDRDTTPLEAGLGWSVKLKGDDFIGKSALQAQKQEGLHKQRVGFVMKDSRRAPREGYGLFLEETQVGVVTSGSLSPTLGYPIGMGYVNMPYAARLEKAAAPLTLDIRGKRYPLERVPLPFYRRKS